MIEIKVRKKLLNYNFQVRIPKYENGVEFEAALDRSIELGPGNKHTIPTGLIYEIPDGYEMRIYPRQGLALDHGILVVPERVQSGEEVKINLINLGKTNFVIRPRDKIAMGLVGPVIRVSFTE